MDIELLQAQRDKIMAELHLPQSQTLADGRVIFRRSLNDILKALALIDAAIADETATVAGVRRSRLTRIVTSSGY